MNAMDSGPERVADEAQEWLASREIACCVDDDGPFDLDEGGFCIGCGERREAVVIAPEKSQNNAWCPVCRGLVPIKPQVAFPQGQVSAWEVFDVHGCDHDGRKVLDRDHGFVTGDGRTVPEWEFLGSR